MSRTRPVGPWRRSLTLLLAVQWVASACAGTPSTTSPSASLAAVAPTTATSIATSTPRPTRTPTPDPYAGLTVVDVDAQTILFLQRELGYMAVTADDVWAATNTGLVQIDPKTLKVQNVDEDPRFGLAASADAVWVSDFGEGTAARLEPASTNQTVSVELPGNPNAMTIDNDAVWVAQHRNGTVTRLLEPSGDIVVVVEVGPAGSSGPQGVVADATAVWVGVPNIGSVVRIDPSTNEVVATVKTNVSPCGGIALQSDAVWVSSCFDGNSANPDRTPRTNTLVAEIDIGGYNGVPVLIDGYPWFPVYNQLVRIDPGHEPRRSGREVRAVSRVRGVRLGHWLQFRLDRRPWSGRANSHRGVARARIDPEDDRGSTSTVDPYPRIDVKEGA